MPTVAQRLEKDYFELVKLRERIRNEIIKMTPGPATEPVTQGLREVDGFFDQGQKALFEVITGIDKTLGFGGRVWQRSVDMSAR